jgi:hypothetical protein
MFSLFKEDIGLEVSPMVSLPAAGKKYFIS